MSEAADAGAAPPGGSAPAARDGAAGAAKAEAPRRRRRPGPPRPGRPIPDDIVEESRGILEAFPLCDPCLGRLYAGRLRLALSGRLGGRIRMRAGRGKPGPCYVCRGLLERLDPYVDRLADISGQTHYSSFLIGAVLKPSVIDRDDLLRSRFRLRGTEGVKSGITRSLTRSFARRSKKAVDRLDPELTLTVDFRTDTCRQRAKPVVVSGRYTKTARGLPQRQRPCTDCGGKGCIFCGNRGIADFGSVEGAISRWLYGAFGCQQAKFTWVGGEDRDSLVLGRGRPFFARLVNPLRRDFVPEGDFDLRADGGGGAAAAAAEGGAAVRLHGVRKVGRIPCEPTRFRSRVRMLVRAKVERAAGRNAPLRMSRLRSLERGPIAVCDGGRSVERRIRELAYERISPDSFALRMLADGGIPMKRLVEGGDGGRSGGTAGGGRGGGGITSPSVSEILGVDCTCVRFDFEDIETAADGTF